MERKPILSRLGRMENHTRIPVAELCGRNRLLIENHLGVLAYGTEEIRIKVNFGFIQVTGTDLKLMELCREQLVIMGRIDGLELWGGQQ